MKGIQSRLPHIFLWNRNAPVRYAFVLITGVMAGSIVLSYLFQEIVFNYHCVSKLTIIFLGNLIFWFAFFPLIKAVTKQTITNKSFYLVILSLGVGLLLANQIVIKSAIFFIFRYGFGCLEGITDSAYMLFENNILTSGLIYFIISLLAYQQVRMNLRNSDTITPDSLASSGSEMEYRTSLIIKNNGSKVEVKVQDIIYVEAKKNTLLIYTQGKKHVLYKSMVSLEKELDPEYFIKIHRSFLVNKSFINSYSSIGNGNVLVKMLCGKELVMTRHYKSQHIL